jgi:predicted TIM-barrel fold metal-dependent hydrolase
MISDIVDVHAHVGVSSALQVAGSAEDVLRKMDANGISQSVISPIPGYQDPRGVDDSRAQNDNIAAAVRGYPDRFPRGLGVIEPRHGKDALPEVDRVVEGLGLAGLMFHNDFNGVSVDSPAMFDILEKVAQHPGMIVQVHTAAGSILEAPFQLGKLAAAFPSVTFLDAHPMMDIVALSATLDLAERLPNLYFDTCLTHHHLWPIDKAVAGVGEDRLLFGSDNPYFDHSIDVDIIAHANISEAARSKIFRENARRLFGF